MNNILYAAQEYWAKGFSIIPVNADKRPAINWKPYQDKAMGANELDEHFKNSNGIALVTGFNDLVCIDFDTPNIDKFEHETYDIVEDFVEPFLDIAKQFLNDDQYAIAESKSGGRHFYIRVEDGVFDGNLKLAYMPAISKATGKPANKVIIETRGRGGYVICFPSEGYKWLHADLQDNELTVVTKSQYEQVIELPTSFSQVLGNKESFAQKQPKERNLPTRLSVIDAFNEKHYPSEFLERNGYKLILKGSFIDIYLAPDSTSKNAGVRLFHNTNKAIVFSHHANDLLGDGKGHDTFDVFKILEHSGDFDSALKAAREELGIPTSKAYRANTKKGDTKQPELSEEPWGELLEISEDRIPISAFDAELIPIQIREWVLSKARMTSVHIEYILMPLIASIGGIVAHKIGVHPKRKDKGWCEATNLWCAIVGQPSTRKTGSINAATSFAKGISNKAVIRFGEEKGKRQAEVKSLEAKGL